MTAGFGDSPLAAEAAALFGGLDLDEGQRLLITRSFEEADPGLRRAGWLLAGMDYCLSHAFLEPMETWGASESFRPLREYERAERLAFSLNGSHLIGAPVLYWGRRRRPRPPARWRWAFWGLMAASTPLSLFGAIALVLAAGAIPTFGGIAAGLLPIAMGLAMPVALGEVERRWLYRRFPMINPARFIACGWMLPRPQALAEITLAARDVHANHGPGSGAPPGWAIATLEVPSFAPPAGAKAQAAARDRYGLSMVALRHLATHLRSIGRDPAVDAALSVLATQERSALLAQSSEAISSPPARSRSL